MAGPPLNIAYKSINHYLVNCRGGMLLIDPGWAGTLPQLRAGLRRYGIEMDEIRYVMFTHHHPDHAGLTQEVKAACGAKLIIHQVQVSYLAALPAREQNQAENYPAVRVERDDIIVKDHGRQALNAIGVSGTIVETPGHSDDSVSLALDDGSVFVGDLHLPNQVDAGQYPAIAASWQKLIGLGARIAYPGHGNPVPVAQVAEMLAGPPAG